MPWHPPTHPYDLTEDTTPWSVFFSNQGYLEYYKDRVDELWVSLWITPKIVDGLSRETFRFDRVCGSKKLLQATTYPRGEISAQVWSLKDVYALL